MSITFLTSTLKMSVCLSLCLSPLRLASLPVRVGKVKHESFFMAHFWNSVFMFRQQGTRWQRRMSATLAVCWIQGLFRNLADAMNFLCSLRTKKISLENGDWGFTPGCMEAATVEKRHLHFWMERKVCTFKNQKMRLLNKYNNLFYIWAY